MKVLRKYNDKLTLYAPIEKPNNSPNCKATMTFLDILTYSGEIATVDEGILATKYKTLTTNVIPKLIKYGYLKKKKSEKRKKIVKSHLGQEIDEKIEILPASHTLTPDGEKALMYQNRDFFKFNFDCIYNRKALSNYNNRFNLQDFSSLLVLFEMLDINYSYHTHPKIGNEYCFENEITDLGKQTGEIMKSLDFDCFDEPLGYTTRVFSKTTLYLDYFFGLICRGFICANKECFPVYVFDNFDIKNTYKRIKGKNERKKIIEIFSTKNVKRLSPYNYPISAEKQFLGNAFCTVANNSRIENVFVIKKQSTKYIDDYGIVKERHNKNIRSLISIGYKKIYLLVRNYKYLKEQFALCLANFSEIDKINNLYIEDYSIDKTNIYLKNYYKENGYTGNNNKYGFYMNKVSPYDVCPTHTFTSDGCPIYFLWDLDIIKIHKAIMDHSVKEKVFVIFEEQLEIFIRIINCYKFGEQMLGITVEFIEMNDALKIIKYNK